MATAIEVARQRLRRGHRLAAAELLDRCVRALARDRVEDGPLTERWAYAHRLLHRSPAGSAQARLLATLSAGVTNMLRSYPR